LDIDYFEETFEMDFSETVNDNSKIKSIFFKQNTSEPLNELQIKQMAEAMKDVSPLKSAYLVSASGRSTSLRPHFLNSHFTMDVSFCRVSPPERYDSALWP
jgi:hypothetical protein